MRDSVNHLQGAAKTMNPENFDEGDLMKVINIDEESGFALFRMLDGKSAKAQGIEPGSLSLGDVVFYGADGLTKVSREAWPTSRQISIVREVQDDGTILGESGGLLSILTNPIGFSLRKDSTVETDTWGAIQRVLSDQPIRPRPSHDYELLSPSAFLVRPDDDGLSFDDFGGYPNVVARAKELIETQLERRSELEEIGARPVKGILFTGPPGTGKTHLARIIANQSGADFYEIGGPEIVSKWVGDTEDILRKIFEAANASERGKSIIFFDEIDSLAENRSENMQDSSRKLVAQFLTLLDGFDSGENATIVIAATNRVEALDPALTRPGRFDWEIEFGLPTLKDRTEILRIGMRRIGCADDLPIVEVATRTHNWSAARLTSIWTEAALIAASDGRKRIAGEDFAQGYERVARRPERQQKSRSLNG
ncbi:AAA family ATPase [Hyphobacterium sp. SN044]|uniref:ATP-binding protein n=1 Tax=Hyphobacterium sp. SN044 TaxID=2912575 RepID=UPI001F02E862|nr:ATP-binding protein [Hyphobacterium sp. SN044]MCF8880277.1 AAA family ATPase [Hyphobacterium sp. SN044]